MHRDMQKYYDIRKEFSFSAFETILSTQNIMKRSYGFHMLIKKFSAEHDTITNLTLPYSLRQVKAGSASKSAFQSMGHGVPLQMPWSKGQPDAGPPVFSTQADLVLISSTQLRLSQLCPAPGSTVEPAAQQHKVLTIESPDFDFCLYCSKIRLS